MAEEQTSEDQTSREMLEQLAARIEHLERVMQAQTARLYGIELRLGIERAPRRRARAAQRGGGGGRGREGGGAAAAGPGRARAPRPEAGVRREAGLRPT